MKTAKDYIAEIKINDANIDYIRNHPERKINGSLMEDIERAMKAYAAEAIRGAAERATAYNQVPRAYSDAKVDKQSILNLLNELK